MSNRERSGLRVLDRLVQDVRYGGRMLRRAPVFAFVAITAIGLAVGINAGFFTLVDALMLQPLPVANPARLVKLLAVDARGNQNIRFSYPAFTSIAANARSIEDVVAYDAAPIALRTSSTGHAAAGSAGIVSGSYFGAHGGRATLGRLLAPSDDREGAAPAVVLSNDFWTRKLGRPSDVIGRDVVINGAHATVVGVAARDFIGINPLVPDLWMPVTLAARVGATPGELRDPESRFLVLHGRLHAGVDRRRAEAELSALVAASGFVVVLLVLVIACANLANLLLSRAVVRQREIAIHVAIGARAPDVLALALRRELRLILRGLAIGLVLALGETKLLASIVLPLSTLGVGSVFLLGAGLVIVALVATVIPGLAALRIAPMQVLRQD